MARFLVGTASAATFLVNTTSAGFDANPGDGICEVSPGTGLCSVHAAAGEAGTLPGADTILLPAGTYPGGIGTVGDVTIQGAGADVTILDGGGFVVYLIEGSLTIRDVTIRNGSPPSGNIGAGIHAQGDLTVDRCVIANNAATLGGGISVHASCGSFFGPQTRTVAISNSSITGNSATAFGGGLSLSIGQSNASTPVLPCILNTSIVNTTFSGNQTTTLGAFGGAAMDIGVGIGATATLDLNNVTMTQNSSMGRGGGIFLSSGGTLTTSIRNSIIAGNSASTAGPDCWTTAGTLLSDGYNLIEDTIDCSIVLDATDLTGLPPQLGALGANGGATPTHAPLTGSPVVDAANPAAPGGGGATCAALDQRGVPRPGAPGSRCDIGAYEASTCGNGLADAGEACDAGAANGTATSCCDAACAQRPAGAPCPDTTGSCVTSTCDASGACVSSDDGAGAACTPDANRCTDDECDGAGACVHPANSAPCDDALFCNGADTCGGGACSVHAGDPCASGGECADTCNESSDDCFDPAATPCTADGTLCTVDQCDGTGACAHVEAHDPGCTPATAASLLVKNTSIDPADKVQLKWSGGPVDTADFGLPTTATTHELCVFTQIGPVSSLAFKGRIAPGGTCGTKPCWKTLAVGYKFSDKSGATDGMTGAVFKSSPLPGKAKLKVQGKGSSLTLPTLPLDSSALVRAEVRNDIGGCWGSPPLTLKQNDLRQYKGRFQQ